METLIFATAKRKSNWLTYSQSLCQSLSLSFSDKSLEFAVPKAKRSVRSLLFGLPRYVLIFQSLNKTESLLVPIL